MSVSVLRSLVACVLLLSFLSACALSRQVSITSEPAGAQVWLAREPLGPTPTKGRAKTTGSLMGYTFDPQLVTFELAGYGRTIRTLDYRWSVRNVLWSIPLVLGVPGIILWGKEPVDLHAVLTPEAEEAMPGRP